MFDPADTICAIASPPGAAFRGVVRISGPQTAEVLGRILDSPPPHETRATTFESAIETGYPIGRIELRVLFWPTTRSYTGQPSAELHLFGSAPLLQATVDLLRTAGARLAGPGEFTLRAFLAGRIDLTQAEAVLGVIDADSKEQLGVALDQLTGGISGPLIDLRKTMIELLADVEAGLDFVDEDIQFIEDEELARRLAELSGLIASAADRMAKRARSSELPTVVLCGLPNAGKSRLLNAIAGTETAIVSDISGTTRDPVEVRVDRGDLAIRIVDTAGIEELEPLTQQPSVSRQAQELGRELANQATFRLWCAAVDQGLNPAPAEMQPCFNIATKVDLVPTEMVESIKQTGWIPVSSVTGSGLAELIAKIGEELQIYDDQTGVSATAARCRGTLTSAAEALASAADVTRAGGGQELVAAELRLAIDAIGQVTGTVYTDDILDSIFSRFCIGK
jgi:tRNA modification GTPase